MKGLHFHIAVDKVSGMVAVWFFVSDSEIAQIGSFPSLSAALPFIEAQIEVERSNT